MTLKKYFSRTLCIAIVLVQTVAFPSFSIAQEAVAEDPPAEQQTTSSEPTPPAPEQPAPAAPKDPDPAAPEKPAETGPSKPTGAAADTYKDMGDGTWCNSVYCWNATTKQTKPVQAQEYSYNPQTGMWDTTEWVYSPESGKYVANVKSLTAPPAGAALKSLAASGGAGATIDTTGPNSNNTIGGTGNSNHTFDLFFNGAISNTINSNAKSGDSLVQGNTKAGSALTGDAAAIANVLNMLQSSWLGQSSDLATFVANLDGDLYGDLLIDPTVLNYNLGVANSNVDVNLANNGVIDNDINLVATSGNAGVSGNTEAGNAQSGNARAMANVINMINSAIKSGKSFLGMVNINGNFDGDILLPPGVLDALIASTGPGSNNTIGGNTSNNLEVDTAASRTIINDINADTTTGNANVASNTSAGNAQTGTATTGVNTMNVIGQNVKAKNGLLVFVNVLGRWMGVVVDPTTGKIVNTGPNSNNTIAGGGTNNASVKSTENSLINNDISVAAHSGDASVTNNTKAGNAITGDAQASVNLLNMIGSDINVDDWFGVLFINVFGTWFGNFGSDTEHGGFSQQPVGGSGGGAPAAVTAGTTSVSGGRGGAGQVFGFVSRSVTGGGDVDAQVQQVAVTTDEQTATGGFVFGSTDPGAGTPTEFGASTSISQAGLNWWVVGGVIGMITTIIVLIREYILALRAERLV